VICGVFNSGFDSISENKKELKRYIERKNEEQEFNAYLNVLNSFEPAILIRDQ
jgi:hypothetical protein